MHLVGPSTNTHNKRTHLTKAQKRVTSECMQQSHSLMKLLMLCAMSVHEVSTCMQEYYEFKDVLQDHLKVLLEDKPTNHAMRKLLQDLIS